MPTPRPPERHTAEYVTLKEYIDTRLDAIDAATALSGKVLDVRLASLNEIRQALQDRDRTFISKVEFNAIIARIENGVSNLQEDARSLRESRAKLEGKADQADVTRVLIISVIGVLLSLIGLVLGFFGV